MEGTTLSHSQTEKELPSTAKLEWSEQGTSQERSRTRDACTALLGGLARDDVLPGSLSAGSRVSGQRDTELSVQSGARCTYVDVSI